MIASRQLHAAPLRHAVATLHSFTSSPTAQYGRAAAYRRLRSQPSISRYLHSARHLDRRSSILTSTEALQTAHPSLVPQLLPRSQLRSLQTTAIRPQQPQPKEDVSDSSRESEAPQQSKPKEDIPRDHQESADPKSEEEAKQGKEQKEKKEEAPPPPHGDKSPWTVFRETLSSEFKASKEWNDSTKQLGTAANQFTESEGVRKARAAYDATAGAATTKTTQAIKTTATAIGSGASWAWDTKVVQGVRGGVNATGRAIEQTTRPVRETKAFKDLKEVVDDGSSSRYGGWIEKEERRQRREARESKNKVAGVSNEPMVEDPNAGTNVTIHKDSAMREAWSKFKDNSKVMQSLFAMRNTYEESENPLISTARSITDRVAGFFAENETARVIKKFREMDPNFQLEPFLRDLREYILPEVLDAYVKGDIEVLKLWLSAAQFQVYSAINQANVTKGYKADGRILDIRGVDILNARLLEPGDIPVFIVTCRTQEVHVYRNAKTNQLAAGMEDKVQQVTYAIGMTRIPEDVSNPETHGWRMIELQKANRDYY